MSRQRMSSSNSFRLLDNFQVFKGNVGGGDGKEFWEFDEDAAGFLDRYLN